MDTRLQAKLVDAGSALPVDDIDQFPGILIELELNLPFFVHCQLTERIKNAGALTLVLIIEIEFTSSEVEGLRLCIPVNFAEPQKAIGDPADFAASRSGNHMNVRDIVTESAGNGAVADRFHLGESVDQPLIPALFKGLHEHRAIVGSGEVIDFYTDTNDFAELSAG